MRGKNGSVFQSLRVFQTGVQLEQGQEGGVQRAENICGKKKHENQNLIFIKEQAIFNSV